MHVSAHILSTRPLDTTLVTDAAAKGVVVDTLSFIETEAIKSESVTQQIVAAAQQKGTAIFTSMNAVEAVIAQLQGVVPQWDIFCIANSTQAAVQQYFGNNAVVATAYYGMELANQIIDYDRERKIEKALFFCGNQRRDELPNILAENNINVQEIVVYNTVETSQALSKHYDGVLFFSPSAVRSFFESNTPQENTVFFAIGTTTSSAIKHYCNNPIAISQTPSKDALLLQAVEYFAKKQPI
jgi:uroporphyrinogen-III synthase